MAKNGIIIIFLLSCLILTSCSPSVDGTETASPNPSPELTASLPSPSPSPEPTFSIETNRYDAIYNRDSVQAVYLYMNKADVEAVFSPGEVTDGGYTPYDNFGFYVKYYGNDTVKELVISSKISWETTKGILVGSTEAELVRAYGQPLSSDGGVYTYYTLDNELLDKAPSLAEIDINYLYTISFIIVDGAVSSIMLSRF